MEDRLVPRYAQSAPRLDLRTLQIDTMAAKLVLHEVDIGSEPNVVTALLGLGHSPNEINDCLDEIIDRARELIPNIVMRP